MKVEVVSYTQPNGKDWRWGMPAELIMQQIAHAARVSNPSNQNNTQSSEKLVKYLIKNKHWSPLEMVDVTLEIETTRDIARQILRHRSLARDMQTRQENLHLIIKRHDYKTKRIVKAQYH